ncbi:hypothetical protein BWI17_01055 [Betaproteobacteria bacterium GR16-43]|nr:hypothetical protein BWI17_01055 [Betaproteobacteria bacterium GR16-43]
MSRLRSPLFLRTFLAARCFAALLAAPTLHAQTVSFTFDDGFDPRSQPQAAEWNARMLKSLGDAGVKAAYFPAGRFVDSPEGLALVKAWGQAGHIIGNHTYSHTDIDKVTVEAYTADIARNDALLRNLPNFRARLRFPYLREGSTAARRDGVRAWLAKNGYKPAPVSIVTSDWYWDPRFAQWLKAYPHGDIEPFRKAYLQHVWDRAEYSERLALGVLARSPPHVMLLHANLLNAMFLGDMLAMFRAKGWTIVEAEAAFADPLYDRLPKGLPAGNGLLSELLKDTGRPPLPPGHEDHGKALIDALGY